MNKHLMIDFETLSTRPDTCVLELGAVLFTRDEVLEEREWVFDLDEQLKAKLSVTADTLIWWMNQEKKAREVFEKTKLGTSMKVFAPEFSLWLKDKDVRVWANGAAFDIPIIENLLTRLNSPIPWKFWNHRCYRTMKACFGIEVGVTRTGVHHKAIDDSRYQTKCLQKFLIEHPECDR